MPAGTVPIEVKDLDEGRGVAITATAPATVEELIDAKAGLLARAPHEAARVYALADFSGAGQATATPEQIRRLADLDLRLAREWPRLAAAVIAPDDLIFGLGREWQTLAEDTGWDIRVFRARDEAEAWIKARVKEAFGERVGLS